MKHLSIEQQTLLVLLQQSLWQKSAALPEPVDWVALDTMAKQQGVVALAYDGAVALKAQLPDEIRQKWNQQTLMSVMKNERLLAAQDQVLGWLEAAEIPAVVLKGSTVARYYPQPDLRVLGDVDILIPKDKVEQAKEIMLQHSYACHESDHEFHLAFGKNGTCVELHYDVTKLPDSRGGEMTEKETTRFLDCRDQAQVSGHAFPILTESHQALSLLLHMVRHMIAGGIGLRQLCDWAMYVASVDPQSFAGNTAPMLDRCGLLRYAEVATLTCVQYLRLPEKHAAWCRSVDQEYAQLFIRDVFFGGNMGRADKEKFGRILSHGTTLGKKQSYLQMVLAGLTRHANIRFPITKQHKWLLPFFWIYMPVRYWLRALFGLREKKSFTEAAQNAKNQQNFYDMLEIFKVEEQQK